MALSALAFCMSFVTRSPATFSSRPHILPSHPFDADISTEILRGALCISFPIQLQVGFGFPNAIPACFLFLLSYVILLPALECFLFRSEFCQELLDHASRYFLYLCLTSCWDGLYLRLENVILENQPTLLDDSVSRAVSHGIHLSRSSTSQTLLS